MPGLNMTAREYTSKSRADKDREHLEKEGITATNPNALIKLVVNKNTTIFCNSPEQYERARKRFGMSKESNEDI